ncbi:MAG: hypothetical protein M1479_09705 [Actinobacteria bacterium]|nr:hypothetical protein [Actinomycetota bacterium]
MKSYNKYKYIALLLIIIFISSFIISCSNSGVAKTFIDTEIKETKNKNDTTTLTTIADTITSSIIETTTKLEESTTTTKNEATTTTKQAATITEEPTTTIQATTTETTTTTNNSISFVGSKNSDVYHYSDCVYAKKIKPENLITFSSVEEAKNAGYRPCKKCNPPG